MTRSLVISCLAVLCGGACGTLRVPSPTLGLAIHEAGEPVRADFAPSRAPSERHCLLVMLPGVGDDDATRFERHGMVSAARRRSPECDVVVVDAHLSYYLSQTFVERLATDVLHEARRHGYRSVWLVGVSLGGYGAVMVARAHPSMVDGVILVAPMLGVPPKEDGVAREISDAGGLHDWPGLDPAQAAPRHHFREPRLVWDWLRETTMNRPERLVLAFGSRDRLQARHRLLAAAMSPSRVLDAEGAHDWETWSSLWDRVLDLSPWRRGCPRTIDGVDAQRSACAIGLPNSSVPFPQ